MKYLIFNLKSKLNYLDILEYINSLLVIKNDIIICPSNIYLEKFNDSNYITCAQDVSRYESGNYTGEVNAHQIASLRCKYTLVGHYERRLYFNELASDLLEKTKNALKSNLKVIYCIGDSLEDETNDRLKRQITDLFDNLDNKDLNNIIIAYEPTWLIGKNLSIDSVAMNKTITVLREFIKDKYHINSDIIYGGSANPDNIFELKKLLVEGYLVGDSSTNINDIFTLYNELKQ